jgi:hypothetical protein
VAYDIQIVRDEEIRELFALLEVLEEVYFPQPGLKTFAFRRRALAGTNGEMV